MCAKSTHVSPARSGLYKLPYGPEPECTPLDTRAWFESAQLDSGIYVPLGTATPVCTQRSSTRFDLAQLSSN